MASGVRIRAAEIIEFGSLPIAKWLSGDDGPTAVQQLLQQLLDAAVFTPQRQYLVNEATLMRVLDVSHLHVMALADVLTAVRPTHDLQPIVAQQRPGPGDPDAVDVHAVALFLFAQVYVRRHHLSSQQPALDVWPGGHASEAAALDPSSPGRQRTNHTAHFLQQRSNAVVRKELAAHLHQQTALLTGYAEFLQRNARTLLTLCLDRPSPPGASPTAEATITAGEVDRLILLLAPLEVAEDTVEDGGSPMDVTPTPFTADTWRLSLAMPMFKDLPPEASAPLSEVADWLSAHIVDDSTTESMVSSPTHSAGSRGSWEAPLPPAGQIVQGGVVDVQGVCKSTVVRGEGGFPSGTMRVSDCHDTVVYALAPLQFASVFACSDCTVVIGAVGRMVRLERCERVQLICAAARIIISSCHDCILHLAVNRAPLLIGDNRFLQLAPYNTQYERLAAHMEEVGVFTDPNLWDQPVSLAREHGRATPDTPSSGNRVPGGGPSGSGAPHSPGSPTGGTGSPPPAVSLLPPDKLLPFMIPFRGGSGSLCGGAASAANTRWSADLGSLVGLGGSDGEGGGSGSGSPMAMAPAVFPLPPEYEAAKDRKVASVADLRNAVKTAQLDDDRKRELQAVIQAHFKEWLLSSGNMRQVYDLARMERNDS
mmetsp:Transcript_707/g.2084  ORF Transcript_707/g.2084 Transcript_707/m.2084 type:complete len:651 (+) Transcript_707:360-2312(+)|eukprot:CAMPEP_0206143510 /NCGR_PEP_ID=MMETSP1473-20131121/20819_1 /ASSEMBLY_ACC=CAM_ASM_001109 /TAXON_ID=1461547 /ORGANISM="Stichococcus sp, Strain RCC1054" /LENGTH=650 /DNA_ID=CAMNT_0053538951 /DNA_START=270 /DNA_END=2222 /DNA_ORIENTATION=+